MHCWNCGHALGKQDDFCGKCGTRQSDFAARPQSPPAPAPVVAPAPAPTAPSNVGYPPMAPPFRWDWVLAIGGLLGILRLLVPAWGYGMGDDGWEITASFPWEWAYEAESDYLLLANFAKYAVVGLLAFIFSFTPRGTP